MTFDMNQFHQTFFEESFEGLDVMENALLSLSGEEADPDLIHAIFRAAHSIKGGSGTFGFSAISDFTHVLETLLDEMRDGQRELTRPAIDLMLESVDVVRDMLTAARDGTELDAERVAQIKARLDAMLAEAAVPAETDPAASPDDGDSDGAGNGWRIRFRPLPHLMQTGNDPVRILRELAGLGDLQVQCDLERLPPFADLAPEEIFLAWELELRGGVARAEIDEIFEWVEDDCELEISPLAPPVAAEPDTADAPAVIPQTTPAAAGKAAESAPARSRAGNAESSSIRVGIDKIDALINIVGELVITQSILGQTGEGDFEDFDAASFERLRDGLAELERNTRELQEGVMRIRMLPISFSFNRFPRLVHDLSQKLGKQVELRVSGEQTELDKTVLEKIGDPLVHLVRNSMDHGIESPEQRLAAGKPETGVLQLNACHQGGNIVIQISDDGAGLNRERILDKARERGLVGASETPAPTEIDNLIFEPGFSTADAVSDVSGRGVGMDVVRRNINDLGGSIEVASEPGQGSTITIRLPLTLAILDGQQVRVGHEIYIIPLVSIVESLQIKPAQVNSVAGQAQVYKLRDEYIPIVNMHEVFGVEERVGDFAEGLLVVVEGDGRKVGLVVDDLLGQQQVVIKSLESNFKRVDGVAGATILGDGTVALIVDVGGLIRLSKQRPGSGRLRLVS